MCIHVHKNQIDHEADKTRFMTQRKHTNVYGSVCVCEYIAFIETGCIVKYIVYKQEHFEEKSLKMMGSINIRYPNDSLVKFLAVIQKDSNFKKCYQYLNILFCRVSNSNYNIQNFKEFIVHKQTLGCFSQQDKISLQILNLY